MKRIKVVGVVAVLSAGIALGACGDDDNKTTDSKAPVSTGVVEGTAAAGTTATASITVDKPWARTSPMSAKNGAVYMVLTAPTADKLIKASVDATVAATVEIHETVMVTAGTGMMPAGTAMGTPGTGMGTPGTGMSPAMTMKPVEAIELPAGTAVELKPGGYHIMLLDLVKPLKVGESIAVTLTFEKAGSMTVDVPVLDAAP